MEKKEVKNRPLNYKVKAENIAKLIAFTQQKELEKKEENTKNEHN